MAKLRALVIDRDMKPGRYGDGGGLCLLVGPTGSKSWIFRYKVNRQERNMGLGPYESVSLAMARLKAAACRQERAEGKDPMTVREAARAREQRAAARALTFKECAEGYIAANEAAWRSTKNRKEWRATLAAYVYPKLGRLPVAAIDRPLVLQVLRQPVKAVTPGDGRALRPAGELWLARPHTAARLRGRIESILDWAKVHDYREGENPARWRGNISHALPKSSKVGKAQHRPALPYGRMADFMADLRSRDGVAALALEFCILNATRSVEALPARLAEIDEPAMLWTIPEDRMKGGKQHRVPLAAASLTVLEKATKLRLGGDYVFRGRNPKKPPNCNAMLNLLRSMGYTDATGIPAVVHGFRSTFRDWAAECTNFQSEVIEMALAHTVGNEVEAAYRRGDLFEKRRKLMDAWADYCGGKSNVVLLPSVAA